MASPLFRTKPLSLLLEEMQGENRLGHRVGGRRWLAFDHASIPPRAVWRVRRLKRSDLLLYPARCGLRG